MSELADAVQAFLDAWDATAELVPRLAEPDPVMDRLSRSLAELADLL